MPQTALTPEQIADLLLSQATPAPPSNTSSAPTNGHVPSHPIQPPPIPKKLMLVKKKASSYTKRKVKWLWEDRIPMAMITMTPGRAGIGKSCFHAWLVAQLTQGTLPGCYYGQPRNCIIAASEDLWEYTIVPRLDAAGADLDLVSNIEVSVDASSTGEMTLTLPVHIDEVEAMIREDETALMSIDPLLGVIDAKLDSYKNAEVRRALAPLVQMAGRTGCTILGNAHYTKAGGDPLTSITGSTAFGEVTRAVLGFIPDKDSGEDICAMGQAKNNLGKMNLPTLLYEVVEAWVDTSDGPSSVGKLEWRGESKHSIFDLMGDKRTREERSVGREVEEWLIRMIKGAGGEISSAKLEKARIGEGYSQETAKRARRALGVVSEQRSDGWYVSLPPDFDLLSRP